MKPLSRFALWLGVFLFIGGLANAEEIGKTTQALSGTIGGIGPLNGVEWQVDMPWRMEPIEVPASIQRRGSTSRQPSGSTITAVEARVQRPSGSQSEAGEIGPAVEDKLVTQYDPIPITFTINDAQQQEGTEVSLGRFCGLYVIEFQPDKVDPEPGVTFIPPGGFFEIEASRRWEKDGTIALPISESHQLRRMWAGDSPDDLLMIRDWVEWNGTAYYTPVAGAPKGKDLRVIAAARVSTSSSCTTKQFTAASIVNKLREGNDFSPRRFEELVREEVEKQGGNQRDPADRADAIARVSEDFTIHLNDEDSIFFGDFLRTHYAARPLPKFGDDWAYGDLHYHSQGTDNEGESGTSYRSALASMKALGLDYAFATDHASDGEQLTGINMLFLETIPSIHSASNYLKNVPGVTQLVKQVEDAAEDFLVSTLEGAGVGFPQQQLKAYRDMSPERFSHLHGWLQGPGGGNRQVGARPGSKRLPQIFLGGEVDVIPEASAEDAAAGYYVYGDGLLYRWRQACLGLPDIVGHLDFAEDCVASGLQQTGGLDGRVSLQDVQGLLITDFFARQHLLYLPRQTVPSADSGERFLSSQTSQYGGATRHLTELIDEVDDGDLGFLFLAHPVVAAGGSGVGRLGPDIYPYSKAQLGVAFASPRVLGLQIWNENARHHTVRGAGSESKFPFLHRARIDEDSDGALDWSMIDWRWSTLSDGSVTGSLYEGAAMWDMVNLWGITPERTKAIGLSDGKPRKFFMAGGSDAHGDFNYRREGAIVGWASANDTAIGSPRNLTYVGSERPSVVDGRSTLGQDQVLGGLRSGQFTVTDGPALRIAVDKNGNGQIDSEDVPMGGDLSLTSARGGLRPRAWSASAPATIEVVVEWSSTSEWGPVKKVELLVGVQNGTHQGLVYRPMRLCGQGGLILDASGREHCTTVSDIYVRDASGVLSFDVPIMEGMRGRRTVELDVADYPLFDRVCRAVTSVQRAQQVPNTGNQGDDDVVLDPLPPPTTLICTAENVASPERMFVRAVATTVDETRPPVAESTHSLQRFAYTNPIWIRGIPDSSQSGPDTMAPPTAEICSKTSTALCSPNRADCVVIHTLGGEPRDVCRWASARSASSCKGTGGIWTTAVSQYGRNHPDVVPPNLTGTCTTEPKNLICQTSSVKQCKSRGATCDVVHALDDTAKDVCRWGATQSARACSRTVGIWTTADSKYGRNHPNALRPGTTGACITEVANLRRVID